MKNITVDREMIEKVCNLILTTELKLRGGQKAVKGIFNDISGLGEGHEMIESYFKESLSSALIRFVQIIDNHKIDIEKLRKEVTVINSILKFAKNNAK